MADSPTSKEVMVLGAGMVGVSTALALQERGFEVTLVDRRSPGLETSYGNAGVIQSEAVEPYALPRDFAMMLNIALGRNNRVRYHLSALPSLLKPLLSYHYHSNPLRHRKISETYSALIRRATADHQPLIEASGAANIIRREGFRAGYRSEALLQRDGENAQRLSREYGVGVKILSTAELAKAEPALTRPMAGAIHWTDSWTCSDPGGLVKSYAELFVTRGGRLVVADANTLQASGAGWRVTANDGPIEAANVVVALGPWVPELLRRFGYRIPMIRKRGYHQHFRSTQSLDLPFTDVASSAVVSPTKYGLRIATGAELAAFGTSETPVQLQRAEAGVREILSLGSAVEPRPWHGYRPCLPDMLPAVGAGPRHKGLWFNIGHGHQGFTLGPTTAQLLSQIFTGDIEDRHLLDRISPQRLKGL